MKLNKNLKIKTLKFSAFVFISLILNQSKYVSFVSGQQGFTTQDSEEKTSNDNELFSDNFLKSTSTESDNLLDTSSVTRSNSVYSTNVIETETSTSIECSFKVDKIVEDIEFIEIVYLSNINGQFECIKDLVNESFLNVNLINSNNVLVNSELKVSRVKCENLLPLKTYSINFNFACISNEYNNLNAATKFNELKCTTQIKNSNIFEYSCEDFASCQNCRVSLHLINSADNSLVYEIFYDFLSLNAINGRIELNETSCGEFELRAYINSSLVDEDVQISISNFTVFPEIADFSLESFITKVNIIALRLNLANSWFYCAEKFGFKFQITINRIKDECGSDESFKTDPYKLDNQKQNILITFESTEFSIVRFGSIYNVELNVLSNDPSFVSSKTKTIETDLDTIEILKMFSTENTISFDFKPPKNCITSFYVECTEFPDKINSVNASLANGKGNCSRLIPNKVYKINAFTIKGNKTKLKTYDYYTIKIASLSRIYFEPETLNATLEYVVDDHESTKNYICFKNPESENPTCLPNLLSISNRDKISFYNYIDFGETYNFLIKTTIHNDVFEEFSKEFPVKIALDRIKIESPDHPLIELTKDSITIKMDNSLMPLPKYNKAQILCINSINSKDSTSNDCSSNYFPFVSQITKCSCENLTSGIFYEVQLIVLKPNWEPNINRNLGKSLCTKVNQASITYLEFEKNSLNLKINFTYSGNFDSYRVCIYKRNNESFEICRSFKNYTLSNIHHIVRYSTSEITYGELYQVYVEINGCNSQSQSTSLKKTSKTDLDAVKDDPNIEANINSNSITIRFNKTYLPSGKYSKIEIACKSRKNLGNSSSDCNIESDPIVCTCKEMKSATQYDISLVTNKESIDYVWLPREKNILIPSLDYIFTKPEKIARDIELDKVYEKNFTVKFYLPNNNVSGLIVGVKQVASTVSTMETKKLGFNRNERKGDYCFLTDEVNEGDSVKCKHDLNSKLILYTFDNLLPGENYLVTVRTFFSPNEPTIPSDVKIESEEIQDYFSTELDFPEPLSLELDNKRLRLKFKWPQTINCNLTFTLKQKDTNENLFTKYDTKEVFYSLEAINPKDPESYTIEFGREIKATKHNVKYQVDVVVGKWVGEYKKKSKTFDNVYVVPFPSYIVIIIVVILSVSLLSMMIGGLIYLRRKHDKENFKTSGIDPSRLKYILNEWDSHQNEGCDKDFETIKEKSIAYANRHKFTINAAIANKDKNRYGNILPYDHSRVKLITDSCDINDYINASFIPGNNSQKKFIACQSPLEHTIEDFWRMIWERNTSVVIMLSNIYEFVGMCRNKQCDIYWPVQINETIVYGEIKVTLLKQINKRNWVIRKINIEGDGIGQNVKHFQFTSWPDKKSPDIQSLYEFIGDIRGNFSPEDNKGPTVVHCSAGVGRTGTYLAIETLMEKIDKKEKVNILGKVFEMRKHRPQMVQNSMQYKFIFEYLNFYYHKINNIPLEKPTRKCRISGSKKVVKKSRPTTNEIEFTELNV